MDTVTEVIEAGVIKLSGVLDKFTLPQLMARHILDAQGLETAHTLDLSQLTQIDSAGLAFCMELIKKSKKFNIRLEILNPPARLYDLIEAQGLRPLMSSYLSMQKASQEMNQARLSDK